MQNPKELIRNYLKNWLSHNNISVEFEVSLVSNSTFGDFTSNIAMIAVKEFKGVNNPRILAEKIVTFLKESHEINEIFDKIEVAGPGFINLFLSSKHIFEKLNEIVQKGVEFGRLNNNTPRKVIVEFGDPNPFKEIHIGHLRNFCIGESFSKLLEAQGNQVTRANYQGDVGLHVAKAMWGLLKREEAFLDSGKSEDEKIMILAESYVEGATEFENNEAAKQDIIDINKKIYGEDESLHQLWEEGKKVSLEHFEELYKRVGLSYDKYYFESVTAKKGKEIVLSHIEDGVFERSDGAVVYRGENEGLHTRVFLTSADYATYEGKDLALAILKDEDGEYDESVILTGNEQLEYFQVMLAALKKIAPELAEKTKHFTFGHVRLKDGKMSSRTGDVISAQWLLDEAVKKVSNSFPEMNAETAEKVGIGAVKYSMLKFSIPSDIHFDFDESITLEGNSGPYLQYTYVRTLSVRNKFEALNPKSETNSNNQIQSLESEEKDLLRFLSQYPYHLEIAAKEFAPNLLCNYLFELSQKFNLFYQKCKIIGSDNEEFRLHLTLATGIVIQNGLQILGIETVEKM
ncbi:MAG: arginine--tRNA ligase [Candidatus Levybacteria bacterium]|nr:arginine--tRNA ligase [Candidatus Levybacteria bacterium]